MMMRWSERKQIGITISAIAVLALGGCKFVPPETQEQECECAEDGGHGEGPDAEPTASIFGPEADVPEPDAELGPLEVTIGFPDGGAQLDANGVAALEDALGSEQMKAGGPITLSAHSDAGGSDKANLDASQARGLAVAQWLIERGIEESRIEVIVFGEQNPAQPNALPDGAPNEAGRAANRRVVLTTGFEEAAAPQASQQPTETAEPAAQ